MGNPDNVHPSRSEREKTGTRLPYLAGALHLEIGARRLHLMGCNRLGSGDALHCAAAHAELFGDLVQT